MYFSCQTEQLQPYDMRALYGSSGYHKSYTTDLFWEPHNVMSVFKTAEQCLQKIFKVPKVTLIPDQTWFDKTAEIIAWVANNGDIKSINQRIVDVTVDLHRNNITRQKLYTKWFLFDDRVRHLSYPKQTHGRHRVEGLSGYLYSSQTPDGRYHDDFQCEQKERFSRIKRPVLFNSFYMP